MENKMSLRFWSADNAESALRLAYPFSFHEDLKGSYVSFISRETNELALLPNWSKNIANAYMSSDIFAKYLQQVIALAIPALETDEAKQILEGFRFKTRTVTGRSYVTLQAAQDFLVKNPRSDKWLTLIIFAHSRGISVTARREFDSISWSDESLFIMKLETAFVRGDGKSLSRMLARDMKNFSLDFPSFIARNSPAALATMVGLNEKSEFFEDL
ncbi:MAG: hypothetical protein EOO52_13635 [Gammaproteobacteria bacterium]|nr:MAG: hypothetical protein EOO52_13635 [Gammaproteobacteria bacterium]